MWGGRLGEQRKLGILFGGTWDHNNRGINDVELAWDANAKGTPIPVEWDQRDYLYDRTRWGANSALDYRFDDGSSMFLRGAWSRFKNFGVVYKYDIAADGDSRTGPPAPPALAPARRSRATRLTELPSSSCSASTAAVRSNLPACRSTIWPATPARDRRRPTPTRARSPTVD
jgi:hypothetical protein